MLDCDDVNSDDDLDHEDDIDEDGMSDWGPSQEASQMSLPAFARPPGRDSTGGGREGDQRDSTSTTPPCDDQAHHGVAATSPPSHRKRKKGCRINNPLNGMVYLSPFLKAIVDTPQYQRTKNIKQLGACFQVFPGGGHTRYQLIGLPIRLMYPS